MRHEKELYWKEIYVKWLIKNFIKVNNLSHLFLDLLLKTFLSTDNWFYVFYCTYKSFFP